MEKAERLGIGKGWTDGRQKSSEQGGREGKAFLPDTFLFVHPWEAVPQRSLGTCRWQLHHRGWSQREEHNHTSLLSTSVGAAGSLLHQAFQTADWGNLVMPLHQVPPDLGPERSCFYIIMIHLVDMAEKAQREYYHVLLPSSLVAVAQRMTPSDLQMHKAKSLWCFAVQMELLPTCCWVQCSLLGGGATVGTMKLSWLLVKAKRKKSNKLKLECDSNKSVEMKNQQMVQQM